jgi:hypothetical protein
MNEETLEYTCKPEYCLNCNSALNEDQKDYCDENCANQFSYHE